MTNELLLLIFSIVLHVLFIITYLIVYSVENIFLHYINHIILCCCWRNITGIIQTKQNKINRRNIVTHCRDSDRRYDTTINNNNNLPWLKLYPTIKRDQIRGTLLVISNNNETTLRLGFEECASDDFIRCEHTK